MYKTLKVYIVVLYIKYTSYTSTYTYTQYTYTDKVFLFNQFSYSIQLVYDKMRAFYPNLKYIYGAKKKKRFSIQIANM